jgi:DNA/RNA-binding domain of Phe-tRNA-synthetase-like protein
MDTIGVHISAELQNINPSMALGIIECRVQNSDHNGELWTEIQEITQKVRESLTFESIKDQPQIAATRSMYSSCGKDPSRYRPSAEALMRRIVKGQDLYRINTLVDLINLVSLKTGYSIGGFDASLVEGPVVAGLGKAGEIFNAIGRGLLNIENLPVLRDAKGPIGTPTSDEERTSIRSGTDHLLMVLNAYNGPGDLALSMDYAVVLLKQHANAMLLNREIIAP